LYTTFGFVLFQIEDAALQEACFRVYNDWLAEFCSYAPKQFAGLALIPLFDVERGRQELERCRKMGLRGALIWASPPEDQPYSLPLYDSFWAAAQELAMPLSLHLATGRRKESRIDESNMTEFWVNLVARPHEIQHSFLTLIFAGVLERFPRLKFVSAENDISWAPHLFERADKYFRRFKQGYTAALSLRPSEYFRRQLYATFIDDPMGLKTYHLTGGADNFMWSTDYPHQASTFPRTQEFVEREFQGVPEGDKKKILRDNAAQLYGFTV
jgi:predicted TIM-barrel fold metal-dependent hydrolase